MKQYGSMTDGVQTYKTVEIGPQTWMAENLNYETVEGSKCYDNIEDNCVIYGRLYNWEAAKTACPSGWHLPSNDEWNILMKFVNKSCSDNSNCAEAGTKLKAAIGWNTSSGYIAGTDNYGFSALPGGYNFPNLASNGNGIGEYGDWWSSTKYDESKAYSRSILQQYEYVRWDGSLKNYYLSVRCVRD